jgi:hypothetical protein
MWKKKILQLDMSFFARDCTVSKAFGFWDAAVQVMVN